MPFGAGLGLVFVERIIDFAALLVAMLLVVIFADLPDRRLELFGQSVLGGGAGAWHRDQRVAAASCWASSCSRPSASARSRWASASSRAIESRVAAPLAAPRAARAAALRGLASSTGVASLREPRRLVADRASSPRVLFVSMAAFTWALACAFHFQEWIGFGEAMGVLGITMFGIALPAPPGFAGVFEAAVRAALAVFGVSGGDLAARALAFALVFHWGAVPAALRCWAGLLRLEGQDGAGTAVPLRARWERARARLSA